MVVRKRGKAPGPRRSEALRGLWAAGLLLSLAQPAMAAGTEDAEKLCPNDAAKLTEDTTAAADAWAFGIARSGKVTVGKSGKDPNLLRFDLGEDTAEGLVQIEQLRPRGRLAVVCGRVQSGKLYRLPPPPDAKEAEVQESTLPDTLEVRLYDLPRGDTERARFTTLVKEREKALLTSEVLERERAALRSLVGLKEVSEAMAQLERVPLSKPAADKAMPILMGAQDTLSRLGACPDAGPAKATPGLHRELCREAEALDEKLERLGTRLTDHINALNGPQNQGERMRTLAALQEATKALDAGGKPEGEARKAHCERIGTLNWLHTQDALRLVARVELPRVAPAQVVETWYGTGDTKKSLPERKTLAVLLHQTPNDVTLGWNTPQTAVSPQGPAQAIAAVLSYWLPAAKVAVLPGGPLHELYATHPYLKGLDPIRKDFKNFVAELEAHDKKPGTPVKTPPPLDPKRPTFICRQEKQDAVEYEYKLDTEVAPIALTGTRNIPVEPPESGHTVELHVCDKRPCDSAKDAEHVRNKVKLEV
ncbi:MAG TPA: hypothetical protein VEZ71_20215, partial [Archangium sp.]|nr:hypothetical protein [Archangium sp.]